MSLSCVQLFATPRTAAYQAPPSIGFSRQEYWSGWPLPSPHLAWTPSKAPPHSGRGLYFLIFQSPLLFSLWLFSHLLLTIAALGASIQDLTGVHCFIPSLSSYSPFDLKCPFPTYVSLLKSRECFVHQDPITLGRFCLSSHSIFAHFTFSWNLLIYVHFLLIRLGTLPSQGNIFDSSLSLPSCKQRSQHIIGSQKHVLNSIDIGNRMLGQRMNVYTCCFPFSSKRDDSNATGRLENIKFLWSHWKEGWGGGAGRMPFGDIWDYGLEESRWIPVCPGSTQI